MIDLEKLDNLPHKISVRKDLVRRYGSIWNTRLDYKYTKRYCLCILANRIIKNNIGKNYNNTHKYYIKKSKYYYNNYEANYYFNREFDNRWRDYYVDDKGLIQKYVNTKWKKQYGIISDDFKIVKVHKETGHLFDMFFEYWSKKEITITHTRADGTITSRTYNDKDKLIGYRYKGKFNVAQEEDFEYKIISGTKIEVTSKNDYRYKRHVAETISKNKAKERSKKDKVLTNQQYRMILKEKELKEKEITRIKMIKHGFDPETSFRNDR